MTYNSILSYGGNGNGSTDNLTALNSAIAAIPSGGTVYFPAGTYLFSAQATYTLAALQDVSVVGDGADASVLYWPGGGGLAFTYSNGAGTGSSVHVRDVSFTTGANGSGTGLTLNDTGGDSLDYAFSELNRVAFRGSDGYVGTHYWGTCMLVAVANVMIEGVNFSGPAAVNGVGLEIQGTTSQAPNQFNITSCLFQAHSYGMIYGAETQGVTISQTNFLSCTYGLASPASSSSLNLLQLTVMGCQFGFCTSGIQINYQITATTVTGTLFLVNPNQTGVTVVNCNSLVISGCQFQPNSSLGGTGINVGTTVSGGGGGTITGNFFAGMGTAIILGSGTTNFNVQANTYHAVTTPVSNSSPSNSIGMPTS